MQQRTVISSAIILAAILTAILGYTILHQGPSDVAEETPTPTITSELETTPLPTAIPATPEPTPVSSTPTATPAGVVASAKTGPEDWMVPALVLISLVGLLGTIRALKQA